MNQRQFSTSGVNAANKNYKLVIVGSGTGGTATANKFARKLGKGAVAVIEPTDVSRTIAILDSCTSSDHLSRK